MRRLKKLAAVSAVAIASMGATAPLAAAQDAPGAPTANGNAWGSPGILSGNVIQVPIFVPINACGDNIGLLGALGLSYGTTCTNG